MFKRMALAFAALGAVAGGYLLFIRPWQLRWGATNEEVQHDAQVHARHHAAS